MKHLNNPKKVLLPRVLLPVALLLVTCFPSLAQTLSGTYTIGGTNPDYTAVIDACNALNQQGVSGPVVFNIRPGTYTNQHTIGNSGTGVTGTSATNTVTFQPDPANPGAILVRSTANASATNYTLRLLDADYIIFKNIPIEKTGSSYSRNVLFEGAATNNRFDGCSFTSPVSTSSSTNLAQVYSTSGGANANVFINNTFTGGSSCIYLSGSSSATFEDWVIDNNTADGKYYTFYTNYTTNLKVRNNTISKTSGSGTVYGIYNYYAYGKCEIRNNTITKTTGASSGTFYGIYQSYAMGSSSSYAAITGNTITIDNGTTSYGIYNNYGNYDSIANNTVNISSSGGTLYPLYNYNSSGSTATYGNYMITNNNVLNATATSTSTYCHLYAQAYFKNSRFDNNTVNLIGRSQYSYLYLGYYCDSTTINNNTIYDTTNSYMNVYGYYSSSSAPFNGCEFNNNNVRLRTSGSYISPLYIGYYTNNISCQNNNFYLRSSSYQNL